MLEGPGGVRRGGWRSSCMFFSCLGWFPEEKAMFASMPAADGSALVEVRSPTSMCRGNLLIQRF